MDRNLDLVPLLLPIPLDFDQGIDGLKDRIIPLDIVLLLHPQNLLHTTKVDRNLRERVLRGLGSIDESVLELGSFGSDECRGLLEVGGVRG
jgi:hypothetical protein